MLKRSFVINGVNKSLVVDPEISLADVLRKQLLLTGTKVSCNDGHCGACSVILNGKLTLACMTKMSRVPDGSEITTIEGIGTPDKMHPIQVAFAVYRSCSMWFLHTRYGRFCKSIIGWQRESNPGRSTHLVNQTS